MLNVLLLVSMFGVLNTAAQQPSGSAVDQILEEAKQKAIWDAEHVTFEIEWRFGKPFLEALKARDEKAAAKWFHENFRGATISNTSEVQTRRKGEVVEISRGADSKSAADASVADVMAALLTQIKPVAEIERAGLRVLYINNEGGQKWSTSILLSASGKSSDGGLIAVDSKHQVVFEIGDDAEFVTGPCIAAWKVISERQLKSDAVDGGNHIDQRTDIGSRRRQLETSQGQSPPPVSFPVCRRRF
jgi:hypothetical protein